MKILNVYFGNIIVEFERIYIKQHILICFSLTKFTILNFNYLVIYFIQ